MGSDQPQWYVAPRIALVYAIALRSRVVCPAAVIAISKPKHAAVRTKRNLDSP
jgi:hypothetical protein